MRPLHPQISQTKLWAVIPAAGSGNRFSKTELKQYQYIQNTTVLEHTVRRISQLPLNGYVLAIGTQDTFAQTLAFQDIDKAHFCTGGAERVHSVLNALNHLLNFADENESLDDICEECKKEDESVSQNLILTGFKLCKSCRTSKTIYPI